MLRVLEGTLAPNLAHEVSGVENSAFLLTIGGGARQTPSRTGGSGFTLRRKGRTRGSQWSRP
jgi:hypothetical protein